VGNFLDGGAGKGIIEIEFSSIMKCEEVERRCRSTMLIPGHLMERYRYAPEISTISPLEE
jgi:hypothetical protein